jgi:hypothetical protein
MQVLIAITLITAQHDKLHMFYLVGIPSDHIHQGRPCVLFKYLQTCTCKGSFGVTALWICVLLSAFVVEYIESRANVFEEDRYDPKKQKGLAKEPSHQNYVWILDRVLSTGALY